MTKRRARPDDAEFEPPPLSTRDPDGTDKLLAALRAAHSEPRVDIINMNAVTTPAARAPATP